MQAAGGRRRGALIGHVVHVRIARRWFASGMRPALFALMAMLLGMQLGFASFFVSAIDLHTSEPD